MMRDEGRETRDEKELKPASIVIASEANDRPSSIAVVLLALSMLLSSCGYRLTQVGGIVPEGSRTLAILAFVNNTAEPAVDVAVTQAVVNEFLADGRLQIVSAESADLMLKGSVTTFVVTPSSYSADNYVQSYTVSIGVKVNIEDVKTHTFIWQEQGLGSIFVSSYPVILGDITATKIAKEAAIRNASKDVASSIRSRLLEGF